MKTSWPICGLKSQKVKIRGEVRLAWTANAKTDLDEIFAFIVRQDQRAAASILDKIEDTVAVLLEQPKLGRPGRVHNTRELVVVGTPYIVVYDLDEPKSLIQILTVRHGARDWPDRFE